MKPANAATVTLAAVRVVPVMVKELGPAVVFTQTLPKPVSVVADKVGDVAPQVTAVDALFRGAGAATVKSVLLLLVSVHPLVLRIAAVVLLNTAVAAPSKQIEDPKPTRSITLAVGQPDKAVIPVTNATLPLVADIAISLPADGAASGVGNAAPVAPVVLILIR